MTVSQLLAIAALIAASLLIVSVYGHRVQERTARAKYRATS